MRRSEGLATVQEQDMHLIAKVPLINVPRQLLDDVMADRRRQRTYGAITLRDRARAMDHSEFDTQSHTNKHNIRRRRLVLSARAFIATI